MRTLAFCAVLLALLPCGTVAAETVRQPVIRGEARPSFQITPLVQHLSGRRGQRIRFSFDLQAREQTQSVRIRAVRLKQQLNGLVIVDEASPPPDAVQLTGPSQLDLDADQTATIRGYVDVPLSQSPLHVFGVLVTDAGQRLQRGRASHRDRSGVHVRFVTQYLLRLEVRVDGTVQQSANSLEVVSAGLVERDGRAFAEVEVSNPTESAIDFQLRCRLSQEDGKSVIPAFGLAMPVRAERKEPERYESIIFAQSRLKLAAPLPRAVFPGQYQLDVEWISRRRLGGRERVAVEVRDTDFPAQASEIAQVASALTISPAQIELSLGSRGNRRLPLRFVNNSTRPLEVDLTSRNLDGTASDWVLVNPGRFVLPAERGRNVLVAVQSSRDVQKHRYGLLHVNVRLGDASERTKKLPLAVLAAASAEPSFHTGDAYWDGQANPPAFVVPVDNNGHVHLAPNGRLQLHGAGGHRLEAAGGFNRWILPGEKGEIRFPLPKPLPSGKYDVKIQIEPNRGVPLPSISQQIEVP